MHPPQFQQVAGPDGSAVAWFHFKHQVAAFVQGDLAEVFGKTFSRPFDVGFSEHPLSKKGFLHLLALKNLAYHVCRDHSGEHSFVVDFLVFLDIDADFFSGDDAHYIFAGMADVVVDLWLQGQEWFAVLSCCPRLKCKLQSIFLVKSCRK